MNQDRKRGIRRPRWEHKGHRASTYIHSIKDMPPGTKYLLWCRVSHRLQNSTGNNDDQKADMIAGVKAHGGTVVGVKPVVGRACDVEAELCGAAIEAIDAGAVLLAETPSRFVRPERYNPKLRPYLTAGMIEFSGLRFVCCGATLVTLHDPDLPWKKERLLQIQRGRRQKGKRGGRPVKCRPGDKKQQRKMMLSKVFWLRKVGYKVREIAKMLKRHPTQIQRWFDKLRGR